MPLSPILLEALNPNPMTGSGNNTYLISGAHGSAVLIDAGVGHPDHVDAIDAALAARQARLTAVVVTHGHADHASGAPALAGRHREAVLMKHPGLEDDARVRWTMVDEGDRVEAGDETLVVLRTPGHAPDHIALWHEASRSVFTGDLVVQGSSVMIAASRGGNLVEYLASLERLRALEPRVLFPAHGPRIDDPAALLTAYLAHRHEREQQVLAALKAGRTSVQEIAESIYDQLGPELMAAARDTVRAHLDKLEAEGRASARR